jgi:hypothetical protein
LGANSYHIAARGVKRAAGSPLLCLASGRAGARPGLGTADHARVRDLDDGESASGRAVPDPEGGYAFGPQRLFKSHSRPSALKVAGRGFPVFRS